MSVDWREAEGFFGAQDRFTLPGLYLLAGGTLVEATQSDVVSKTLRSDQLPVLFANLPGALVGHLHNFHVDLGGGGSSVKILYIADRALKAFGPVVYGKLVEDIRTKRSRPHGRTHWRQRDCGSI